MSNPFSDLGTFEDLRLAALSGSESYERYRRRDGAQQRRNMANVIQLQLASRVERMVEVAIASSRAVLLVGPPGTGKTEILEQIIDRIDRDPSRYGFSTEGISSTWVTPEEEWTFEKVVLGETVVDGAIESIEGDLLQALRHRQWLILDETNRADMDRVLGGVLTWLSGKRVRVGLWREPGASPMPVFLEWTDGSAGGVRRVAEPASLEYVADRNWRLLGTYNAIDAQRVFRMGQALSRRFKHVPVPPASTEEFERIIAAHVSEESLLPWLTTHVTALYRAHLQTSDAQLGPGLFVDIPSYVEHGLRMSQDHERPQESLASSAAIEAGSESDLANSDQATRGDSHLPESASPSTNATTDLLEELLAEAYLISVGNLVAKYEMDLLEELTKSIADLQALSPANVAWFVANLQSMRA